MFKLIKQIMGEQCVQGFLHTFQHVIKKGKNVLLTTLYQEKMKKQTIDNIILFKELQSVKKQIITPKRTFGIIIFIHYQLQNLQYGTNTSQLEIFLSELNTLQLQSNIIQISKVTDTKERQTKIDQNKTEKAKLLKILQLYIDYIKNTMILKDLYKKLKFYNSKITAEEYQMFVNSLIFIKQINKQILILTRYYYKEYENYIKFAVQCLTSDTRLIYFKLQKFLARQVINLENQILETHQSLAEYLKKQNTMTLASKDQNPQKQCVKQIIRLFETIFSITEQFTKFYQTKQFYKMINKIQLPNWISSGRVQYKFIDQLNNIYRQKQKNRAKRQLTSINKSKRSLMDYQISDNKLYHRMSCYQLQKVVCNAFNI